MGKTLRKGSRIGKRVGLGVLGFLLFTLSLGLMKEGAAGLDAFVKGYLSVTNAAASLGFGWLVACVVLSGSPVAAATLALLSAGALHPPQAFTMIAGSRLGASFMVLLLGLIYALRGHEQWTALSTGVLSLLLTGSVQLVTIPLGLLILSSGHLQGLPQPALTRLSILLNSGMEPVIGPLMGFLPNPALFLIGIGSVVLSFRLFDWALPQIRLEKTDFGEIPRLVYRPAVMFLMGLVLTLITMSVSVSVGILVPLSARGYMRRENIIPYILGANISTFVDTLVAGALLGDPEAVIVVATHMLCAVLVSLPLVLFAYRPYERAITKALTWIIRGNRNFALFVVVIFLIPVVLILL